MTRPGPGAPEEWVEASVQRSGSGAGGAIDPARLRRALRLDVRQLPGGGWRVGRWTVDARHGCDCPDRRTRGAVCKHELAARLACLDAELRAALRTLAGGAS